MNDYTESIQNPPIDVDTFISQCQKRGIDIDNDTLNYFKDKRILEPSYETDEVEMYSIYEFEWVDHLVAGIQLTIKPSAKLPHKIVHKFGMTTTVFRPDALKDSFNKDISPIEEYIDIDYYKKERKNFNKKVNFLKSIDDAYYPYARSGAGAIQVQSRAGYANYLWHKTRQTFKLKEILEDQKITINDVVIWYGQYAKKAAKLLGGGYVDWMQLFKEISWNKKDKLEGSMRLGIDYLQWALMLKRCIEKHVQHPLLDIDEIDSIACEDILELSKNPSKLRGISMRGFRDDFLSDSNQNNYNERFKRLKWLANDFGLNYHPKLMVFVEGQCEEHIFPKLFMYKYGSSPTGMGIEFVNYKGVGKLQSTAQVLEDMSELVMKLDMKLEEKVLSINDRKKLTRIRKKLSSEDLALASLKDLVSYNLTKWQTIPFFIADNEGGIGDFIKHGKVIRYKDELRPLMEQDYDIPKKWKYMWGIDNNNLPLLGKDLETANFTDHEIAEALTEHIGHEFKVECVTEMRAQGRGISQLVKDKTGKPLRSKVGLVEGLVDKLLVTDNLEIPINERPFNDLLSKIANHTSLNHQPSNLNHQKLNEQIIINDLLGRTL